MPHKFRIKMEFIIIKHTFYDHRNISANKERDRSVMFSALGYGHILAVAVLISFSNVNIKYICVCVCVWLCFWADVMC